MESPWLVSVSALGKSPAFLEWKVEPLAEVTIGIPVYNGEAQLPECLACIVNQSFQDIEILIYDNASTDRTQSIIEEFAARDHRIKYIRRPENVGAFRNFSDPLNHATTPYFMWRAHDDLSSLNYVEKLVAALKRESGTCLAAGTIQFERTEGHRIQRISPTTHRHSVALLDILSLMFGSHAGWFYGLWDTLTIQKLASRIWEEFPHAWSADHLTLYPNFLDRQVAMAPDAVFIQRETPKAYGPRPGQRQPLGDLIELRRKFRIYCDSLVDERDFDPFTRVALKIANRAYAGKRVYPMRKIIKRTLFRY
ncbi:glycosyltransferase family 2 protein [Labrys neptuniae]